MRSATASSKTEIKKINRHLASTPMKGTGKILYNQSKKYGVNPYFVIAVAHKESSLGQAACSRNPRNVWGLGACGRAWTPPHFSNWVQAYNYFLRFLDDRWPSAVYPSQFYNYCSGCMDEWANGVEYRMQLFGSKTTRVR